MAVTDHEYALLSAYAHVFARENKSNLPDLAAIGFTQIAELDLRGSGVNTDGFEGVVVKRGNDIVVAFAGTDQIQDYIQDVLTAFALGEQVTSAAQLYVRGVLAVDNLKRKTEPQLEPRISFTGHSLGGGLASVMGILFNQPAVVFDSAPFQRVVDSHSNVLDVSRYIGSLGFIDPAIRRLLNDPLDAYLGSVNARNFDDPALALPYPTPESAAQSLRRFQAGVADYQARLENVRGHYKIGEVLSGSPFVSSRIHKEVMVPLDLAHRAGSYYRDSNDGFVGWDLHTGTLYNTAYADPRFATASARLWHLIPEIFNSKVEERGYSEGRPSFLEHVTYSTRQSGGSTQWGALLSPFIDELLKIDTNIPWAEQVVPETYVLGSTERFEHSGALFVQGLIQTAIAYYMAQPRDAQAVAPVFGAGSGSVAIDRGRFVTAVQKSTEGEWTLSQLIAHRINTDKAANGPNPVTPNHLTLATEWVVPTRVSGTFDSNSITGRSSFLMGSEGADTMTGADGDDILYGDAGNDILHGEGAGEDTLVGGSDNDRLYGNVGDRLYGGEGFDRYVVDGGGLIRDHDGLGEVRFNDVRLRYGWKLSGKVYTHKGNDVRYMLEGTTLTVTQGGGAEPLVIEQWNNGDLGIRLIDDEPDPNRPDIDARNVPPRADPLVFDLDGDGLETSGAKDPGNNIYFDQTGSGTPVRTGWVGPDDAFLALDRNGNGRIDSGQELFGDSTPLPFGGTAIDGFDALAQEDSNGDGWVDALDARFAELRLWRDLDQDAVSDAGELQSLDEAGIAAIRVTNTGNRQLLDNGNRIADLGSFRWADGRSGTNGTVGDTADVDLSVDLSRQNLPPVAVDPALAGLPTMAGRGAVRSLHEAASLSDALAGQLTAFTTMDRAGQLAAIDGLINTWARSSGMAPLRERGQAAGIDVVYDQFERPSHGYYPRPADRPFQQWPGGENFIARGGWQRGNFDAATWTTYEDYFESRIFSLEAFSGDYFQQLPGEAWPTPSIESGRRLDTGGLTPVLHVSWAASHLGVLLQQRYENLRQQIYDHLVEQTRLAPLLAPLFDTGVGEDQAFAQVEAALRGRIAADALAGIGDLIDVNAIIVRRFGIEPRWHGAELLADTVAALPRSAALTDLLIADRVVDPTTDGDVLGALGGYTLLPGIGGRASVGKAGNDVFVGTGSTDYATGGSGDDHLMGRGGNDALYGDDGDDLLDGGSGDDLLAGGAGHDRYRIGADEGRDLIVDGQGSDTLVFKPGVTPADLHFAREGEQLVIRTGAGSATVRVAGHYDAAGRVVGSLDAIEFEDGGSVDMAALALLVAAGDGRDQLIIGTPAADRIDAAGGNDTVRGLAGSDRLFGGEGRDRLEGGDGDDHLDGGSEDDLLFGEAGDDTLLGGTGEDQLDGGAGNDRLAGGRGRDRLTGGAGVDTFVFEHGDGDDLITDAGASTVGETLRFGAGIAAADLRAARSGDDLLLQRGDSSDRVRLAGWFAPGAVPLDRFEFADGTLWNGARVRELLGQPNPGGASVLAGGDGADVLTGGSGNDRLAGGAGADLLIGGAGDDELAGGADADLLDGGPGNDLIDPGTGNDSVRFGAGAGNDTLVGVDATPGKLDRVLMASAVRSSDVLLYRAGNDLLLTLRGRPDTLRVVDHFAPAGAASRLGSTIDRIDFGDGSRWTLAQINARAMPWAGAALGPVRALSPLPVPVVPASTAAFAPGPDDDRSLAGDAGDNTLEGGAGDDGLDGGAGHDTLRGGAGLDTLRGGDGDDLLAGGPGADWLDGGAGNDTYEFGRGDGSDTISNHDGSASTDRIRLATGIRPDEVQARREGADLRLYVGAPALGDVLRVLGFFGSDPAARIDELVFGDGSVWDADELARRAQTASAADDVVLLGDADDVLDAGPGNDLVDGGAGDDTLYGGSGIDQLFGGSGDDVIDGGSENDRLEGGDGDDRLAGGPGDDVLLGGAGDDHIETGPGNDSVGFGAGSDTLFVRLEDGLTVLDALDPGARESDRIVFDAAIEPADVQVLRQGDDLVLNVDAVRSITVREHYNGGGDSASTLERIEFAADPGTVWTSAMLRAWSLTATPGDDRLIGFDAGEWLDGLAGNDLIDGRAGDDTLVGNAGNDQLRGGEGADTYRFGPGWGHDLIDNGDSTAGRDTVVFEAGIDPAALVLRRQGLDLLIAGAADSVRVGGYFIGEGGSAAAPARFEFNDGSAWDLAAVRALALQGTPGDDTITGHAGDDQIDGGAGNDRLNAGPGNDTYVFRRGFGQDRIENLDAAAGRIDRIRFAGDIAPDEVRASRFGDNLYLSVGSDRIEVLSFFLDGLQGVWRIDEVVFDAAPGTVWDTQALTQRSARATEGDDVLTGSAGDDDLAALGGRDTLLGLAGNDRLAGDAGDDRLDGGPGDDTLFGGAGIDLLFGGPGNDRLDGGPGDDLLDGGPGRDTVVFGLGSGNDTLQAAAEPDALDLSTLSRSALRLSRDGNALLLTVAASGERLHIESQFGGAVPRIDELRLADVTLDAAAIEAALRSATDGDDTIYGGPGDDLLDGLAGNDLVVGQGGNDRLRGGPGADTLVGGPGNDVFVFEAGDGADTIDAYDTGAGRLDVIELGAGLRPADLRVTRDLHHGGNDLLLSLPAGDSLRVRNFGNGNGDGPTGVQQLRFADGSVWNTAELRARALRGSAAAETLTGWDGDDLLEGGAGNDTLNGGTGNDVYRYARGDGDDTIDNFDAGAGRVDTLQLAAGIGAADLRLRRVPSNQFGLYGRTLADDLMLDIAGGGSVRVHHFFAGEGTGGWQIDRIVFEDGSLALELADLLAAVRQGTPGDDLLFGTEGPDLLQGLAGQDTLRGAGGDDILDGGPGDDLLDGGPGNDSYRFAPGWGSDLISQNDPGTSKRDRALFEGIARADVVFSRDATDLFVRRSGSADQLRLAGFFLVDDQNARQVDEFVFSDTTLTPNQIRTLLFTPTEGDDVLWGSANSDAIDGLGGNDQIHGLGGNDLLLGGEGDDALYGGDGQDTLDGGPGNDLLTGGEGNDRYRFGNGRGADRVDAASAAVGLDEVLIDAGLAPAQISLLRAGQDLVLGAPDGSTLRILNFLADGQFGRVTQVRFADGTAWGPADLLARSGQGSDGDDLMIGDAGDNDFDGRGGRDTLQGLGGNDTLDGGAGDGAADTLDGGPGDDSYRFGAGDGDDTVIESANAGNDRILFRVGVTPDSLLLSRSNGDDLLVSTAGGDSLRVRFWFSQPVRVERFEFADGTVWLENDVLQRLGGGTEGDDVLTGTNGDDYIDARGGRDTVFGRAGNDTIRGGAGNDPQLDGEAGDDLVHGDDGDDYVVGGAGNDRLFGDAGNDILQSGSGNDTLDGGPGDDQLRGWGFYPDSLSGDTVYRFGTGWGQDTVDENGSPGSVDVLEFYGGTRPADLVVRNGFSASFLATNLTLRDSADSVLVYGHSQGPARAIEVVRFVDDGGAIIESWDSARIASEALRPTDGDDAIGGTAAGELLAGGAGNDTLVGLGGNDQFDGGPGDDLMVGSGGADTYVLRPGFGRDTIRDRYAPVQLDDLLVFDGMASTAFRFNVVGDNLLVTELGDAANVLTVEGYFGNSGQRIETLQFSDATWGYDQVLANLSSGTDGDDDIIGSNGPDLLDGFGGNDRIRGQGGDDTLRGGDGDDTLEGGVGADRLLGGAGNDKLYGANAGGGDTQPDWFDGGPGFDQLYGGGGADTFRVEADGGFDVVTINSWTGLIGNAPIYGPDHDDILELGGAAPADVTLVRYGYYNLRAYVAGAQIVELQGQFSYGPRYELGAIRFDDGSVWDRSQIVARTVSASPFDDWFIGSSQAEAYDGLAGNDRIEGLGGDDTLRGGAGDDFIVNDNAIGSLFGDDGDDQLFNGASADGGAGNDRLDGAIEQRGGLGDDDLRGAHQANTYRFAPGDGRDTLQDFGWRDDGDDRIVFDKGVKRADLQLQAAGRDLRLVYGSGDSILIVDALAGDQDRGTVIERIEFADGSTVALADLLAEGGLPSEGDDILIGSDDDDEIDGLGGNDFIQGAAGSDTLIGGAGDDTLFGGEDVFATDVLEGGTGDDQLDGSYAGTLYRYARGDGSDTVVDEGGEFNELRLADGVHPGDVALLRAGDALVVRLGGTGSADRITFVDWFLGDGHGIDRIVFDATGEQWDRQDMADRVQPEDGTDATEGDDDIDLGDGDDLFDALGGDDRVRGHGGNDTLIGGDGSDVLEGGDGDDRLDGSGGDWDELDGGPGNDLLISETGNAFMNGGSGADTHRIGAGDGFRFVFEGGIPNEAGDVVELSADIDPAALRFEVDGNGLKLGRNDAPGWSVLMWGQLDPRYGLDGGGVDGPIETLRLLRDGGTMNAAALRAALPAGQWLPGGPGGDTLAGDGQRNSIWGRAGADTLTGGGGDDWLYGGEGDDNVAGNAGNDWLEDRDGGADTYRWQRGDGTDVLMDQGEDGGADRIVFGAGIVPADVRVSRDGGTLKLAVTGTGGGGFDIWSWFDDNGLGRIDAVQFVDGSTWNADDVEGRLLSAPLAAGRSPAGNGGTAANAGFADPATALGLADAVAGFMAAGDGSAETVAALNSRPHDEPAVWLGAAPQAIP